MLSGQLAFAVLTLLDGHRIGWDSAYDGPGRQRPSCSTWK